MHWQIMNDRYQVWKCYEIYVRFRDKNKNYVGHLHTSMVDNATNVLRIIFIVTFSLIVGAFGLYNAWQIGTNSEKPPENLDTQLYIGAPGASFLLAAISLGALLPYSSHALRCNLHFCQKWRMWRNVMLVTLVSQVVTNWIILDFPDPPFSTESVIQLNL